jgi:hypothetical protein
MRIIHRLPLGFPRRNNGSIWSGIILIFRDTDSYKEKELL